MSKDYFQKLKEKIIEIFHEAEQNKDEESKSLTVAEICEKANTTDEDGIMLILAELENVDNEIVQTSSKTVCQLSEQPIELSQYQMKKK
ncbi:MAG: hypothetical protein KAI67_01260 [Candidatus Pacebacteria bacterium]|nr:hypothetical protein [Candidatus Paceibacterota bacterium]